MQEQEAKLIGLNTALQEQESTSSQERKTLGDRLLAQSEELSMARRRINELQVDIDSRERVHEQAVAEAQAVGREQVRLTAQVAEARAQLASARPSADFEALCEELAQVKRTAATEHDQMSRRAIVAEDQVQAMQLAAKHAETKIRQLQEERTDRERELQGECAEMERTYAAETVKLRAEFDKSNSEAETRRLAWREKERELMRQLESASSREEAFKDDFDQCRLSQEEAERRLQEIRRDAQLRACTAAEEHQKQCASLQAELSTLRERVSTLERERNESVSAADVARTALKTQEQRADALQTELASVSQRLDAERSQWAREADEANVAAIRLDEEHRKTATQQLAEDHKRQMNKLNSSYKKTLQKAARKRQEMKHRCQELVKRITVLQQEKALAIRICEENKNTFESRLAELGLVSRLGLGSVGIGAADVVGISSSTVLRADAANDGMMHRRELRAIMERLEQNAEKLQVSVPPASETVSATS
jgi:chromosome segregation ATPase